MRDIIVRWWTYSIIAVAGAGAGVTGLEAQTPTKLLVRVVANDAKIIGSNVGGARITVRDAATGDVLAQGVQEGSTGSTSAIMGTRERGGTVFDTDGAAGFVADLELARPTTVEIQGEGPLGTEHAIQTASKSLLVLPGEDVLGEGIVLVLNGFTVELLQPTDGSVAPGEPFDVRARVTMLCGCPTEPGGMWDSNDYDIIARAVRDTELIGEWPMAFSGETSEYVASATVEAAGDFELQVIASDPGKGNFGLVRRSMTAR